MFQFPSWWDIVLLMLNRFADFSSDLFQVIVFAFGISMFASIGIDLDGVLGKEKNVWEKFFIISTKVVWVFNAISVLLYCAQNLAWIHLCAFMVSVAIGVIVAKLVVREAKTK